MGCRYIRFTAELLLFQDKENKSYLATIAPRRLSSASDIEEKENR